MDGNATQFFTSHIWMAQYDVDIPTSSEIAIQEVFQCETAVGRPYLTE